MDKLLDKVKNNCLLRGFYDISCFVKANQSDTKQV